jgi:hypothetical protein
MNIGARDISVGDKLRLHEWQPDSYVTVTGTGATHFLGRSIVDGIERPYFLDGLWYLCIDPPAFPERWMNVYVSGFGTGHGTRSGADHAATGQLGLGVRLGVIHLDRDGTLTMEAA